MTFCFFIVLLTRKYVSQWWAFYVITDPLIQLKNRIFASVSLADQVKKLSIPNTIYGSLEKRHATSNVHSQQPSGAIHQYHTLIRFNALHPYLSTSDATVLTIQ